jgi:hypothetical protein
MKKIFLFAALAFLPSFAAAQSPSVVYRVNLGNNYRQRYPQPQAPQTGFYRHFASGAVGVTSSMLHRYDSYVPVDTVWQQAQEINPTMIVNPYAQLDEMTLRAIESPYRNFPIQTAR